MRRTTITVLLFAVACAHAYAAELAGRPVGSVIDDFTTQGTRFVYSTDLLPDSLMVTREPAATDPVGIVREILQPHGLALQQADDIWLVVRAVAADAGDQPGAGGTLLVIIQSAVGAKQPSGVAINAVPPLPAAEKLGGDVVRYAPVAAGRYRLEITAPDHEPQRHTVEVRGSQTRVVTARLNASPARLADIAISASRYQLQRELSGSLFYVDQRAVSELPDTGDDPLRAVHRLPGAAAGGYSARAHVRGGVANETAIVLNGQRLIDPFHIRDFQGVFSAIDVRAIDGIEVYTGAFPVRYGDRLSALVIIDSLTPSKPRHTEVGLSVFNTSVLSAGVLGDGEADWLVSARRGNLDLVLTPDLGEPSYSDLFGEFGWNVSPNFRISANALATDDNVVIVTEADPGEREQSRSDATTSQFWLNFDNRWSENLTSTTVLSSTRYSSSRAAVIDDPEKIVGSVDDFRDIDTFGLRQDWRYTIGDTHLLQWGFEAEHLDAEYRYRGDAMYGGLFATFDDRPAFARSITAEPDGDIYSVYLADRWSASERLAFELGLRWDKHTYTDIRADSQLSPRMHVRYVLGPRTDLRFSVGRYYQAQGIQELQVEDGVARFFRAQRADHFIAGFRHRFHNDHALRIEAFSKRMDRLRPRFENLFDQLALIPELVPDRTRINPIDAHARGLEVSWSYDGDPHAWWAAWSLSRVTDDINGMSQLRSWDQRHAVQGGYSYTTNTWQAGIAASVRDGWPTTVLTIETDASGTIRAVPGPRNAERHAMFMSVDARLSRRFEFDNSTLTAFVEVSNLLGRDNICCTDYDLEEDDAGNLVLESSNDFWLPRLPAVGILWEF